MVILLWFAVAVAIGYWASNTGRSAFGWFLIAVICSPVVGAIGLMIAGNGGVKCPKCAEKVKAEAAICKHCKSEMPKTAAVTMAQMENEGII